MWVNIDNVRIDRLKMIQIPFDVVDAAPASDNLDAMIEWATSVIKKSSTPLPDDWSIAGIRDSVDSFSFGIIIHSKEFPPIRYYDPIPRLPMQFEPRPPS